MSKTAIYIHLVFATKSRKRTILSNEKNRLYAYMVGICKANSSYVCAIGGPTDHIHILLDLHPSVALAPSVREIKTSSFSMLKKDKFLPNFEGWSEGYYAGSLSPSHKKQCMEYIENQEFHHRNLNIEDEMKTMANKYNFSFYPDDLM